MNSFSLSELPPKSGKQNALKKVLGEGALVCLGEDGSWSVSREGDVL